MPLQDEPYALADPAEQKTRLRMLGLPHMAPLTKFVRQLRSNSPSGYRIPYLDPCDGGAKATVLFLLEAPGPRAIASGFVSRNNPDPTARNMCNLLASSNLPRSRTAIWNVIPWYIGSGQKIRPAKTSDLGEAQKHLEKLIRLLPELRVVVLVGLKARAIAVRLKAVTRAEFLWTFHPSGRVFNVWPEKHLQVLEVFRQAERKSRKAA